MYRTEFDISTRKPIWIGPTYDKTEHLKKVVSSHRASLDFDKAFLMDKVESADFDFKKEIEEKVWPDGL